MLTTLSLQPHFHLADLQPTMASPPVPADQTLAEKLEKIKSPKLQNQREVLHPPLLHGKQTLNALLSDGRGPVGH